MLTERVLPQITGVIERRILVNYRVDPTAIRSILPAPFEPQLVNGYAIAGICLIELRVRPTWAPKFTGVRSRNGAHRVAVTLPDGSSAVYVPRRDTDSRLNVTVGGRLFPGVQNLADFEVDDRSDAIAMSLFSHDGSTRLSVDTEVADTLPDDSVFADVAHVSDFFEAGSLGYSDTDTRHSDTKHSDTKTSDPNGRFDGLELAAHNWSVTPLHVRHATSSFFEDADRFPPGSVSLDNALLMRNIHHNWISRDSLETGARINS